MARHTATKICKQKKKGNLNQNDKQVNEGPVRLNDLSQFIFKAISLRKQLLDNQLMEMMTIQYGQLRMETLKRRKYDVINILEKASIIIIDKGQEGHIKYLIKRQLPNSKGDVQKAKSQLDMRKKALENKKIQLKMLRNTCKNYSKLIQKNKKQSQNVLKISLPILIATKKFDKAKWECKESEGQMVRMHFPQNTMYINNIWGKQEPFKISNSLI